MNIISLKSENVKRLSAVHITPDGSLVTIGGKNGAGKSSVLDSIAYALGGQTMVPAEPIRAGETEAKIVVDLGEFIVTRKFKREPIRRDEDKSATPDNIVGWGPTTSTLTVTNKDGARYPSPQAVLDKLLGKLTFDPLAFAHANAKDQATTLRKLAGIDTTSIDQKRRLLVSQRTDLNEAAKKAQFIVDATPNYTDVPAEEIPVSEVTVLLEQAEAARSRASVAEKHKMNAEAAVHACSQRIFLITDEIEKLEARLKELREAERPANINFAEAQNNLAEAIKTRDAARAEVPDTTALSQQLKEIEDTNRKVRSNLKRAGYVAAAAKAAADVKEKYAEIIKLDDDKARQLREAKFPVDGLGLNDDGVTFGGVPFEQASTSEQLRVSVAIGLALNPTLKVLLVRNGNVLDNESRLLLAEQAETAGAQVWMEYVTTDAGQVAVMIEDGHQV